MQDTDTTQNPAAEDLTAEAPQSPEVDTQAEAQPTEPQAASQAEAQPAEPQPAPAAPEEDWKDRYTRLAAEFDNFRRRTNKEKDELVQYGNVSLLQAILPVMDDLDRALKAAETAQEVEALRKGLQLVHKNLRNTLEKQGVQLIDSLHQPFDSQLHEAIASMPAAQEELKGKVIEVIEPGYRYREKVIRYAKVITGE
jgi:molecular chaperone GrpE